MRTVLIIIDSVLFAYFIFLLFGNSNFTLFGINMGIWGYPIITAVILLINIIGFCFSFKSVIAKKFTFNFNASLGFLCVLIFFYDAWPHIYPPAIFGTDIGNFIKFVITVFFFGIHGAWMHSEAL